MPVINPKTGKEFRWARNNWTPRTRARWHKHTIDGKVVRGSVRAIAHLDWMNRRSIAIFGRGIEVIQSAYNTSYAASAGTHDYDLVYDLYIPGVGWWRQQKFFRNHGFWCWYRHAPLFGNHIHGFCMVPPVGSNTHSDDPDKRGFKVGVYIDGGYSTHGRKVASSQIDDYDHKAFGLANQHTAGSDHSFYPAPPKYFKLNPYIDRRKKIQAA